MFKIIIKNHNKKGGKILEKLLSNCTLCPRNCGVDRLGGKFGFCLSGKNPKVARYSLHFWEEPCISGKSGSGTVFFSNCTLKCVFCQNSAISNNGIGEEITPEKLAEIYLKLQKMGANNINLVTPTHFIVPIIKSLELAKAKGLSLPIIYNTSGYEKASTIKLLNGLIDVYLPDFKYFNNKFAIKYSNAPNYFEYATESLSEMVNQTGTVKFDNEGTVKSGTIVRHLMLPGLLFDSKKVIDYLYNTYKDEIFISIMNQYTPMKECLDFPELNKKISWDYYNCLIDYAQELGIKNAYIQDKDTQDKSFIPEFFNKLEI